MPNREVREREGDCEGEGDDGEEAEDEVNVHFCIVL